MIFRKYSKICFPRHINENNIISILFSGILLLITFAMLVAFLDIEFKNSYYKNSYVLLTLWLFVEILKNRKINEKIIKALILIILCLLILILGIFSKSSNEIFPIQGMVFGGCLACCLICLMKKKWNESHFFMFHMISGIGAICFLYAFYFNARFWRGTSNLTIGSFNPQAIGIWAYLFYAAMIIEFDMHSQMQKSKFVKMCIAFFTIAFFYITILTEARCAFVAFIFFVLFRILPILKIIKTNFWCLVFSAFPLITAHISIFLFKNQLFISKGLSLLSGREKIWIKYLDDAKKHFLLGNSKISPTFYSHNIYIDHYFEYGIIFAIMFILINYYLLKRAGKNCTKLRYKYDAYMAFCGALMISAIEGMIFSVGSGGIFFYAYTFLFIACS